MMMTYETTPKFLRDLKKLSKKHPSLTDDMQIAKKNALELLHIHKIDNHSIVELINSGSKNTKFYKLKKFACKSLKRRGAKSGIRLIYAYHTTKEKIVFLEIYSKSDKSNHNIDRIKTHTIEH